jgi:hypothetical protein
LDATQPLGVQAHPGQQGSVSSQSPSQDCPGSSAYVYAVLLPEQHAFGVVVSFSEPMQVHTPPVHVPDTHSPFPAQLLPFPSAAAQVPASQYPDWQPESS